MRRIVLLVLLITILGIIYIGLGARCPWTKDNETGSSAPQHNFWTPTTLLNAPSLRMWHSAVWTGTKMIVWGGYAGNNYGAKDLDTGGIYDPILDNWATITTTGAPISRQEHTAIWTGAKMIIWGGWSREEGLFEGGIYDPAIDKWATPTNTNKPQVYIREHSTIWTGSKVIIWGGMDMTVPAYTNTGSAYDPVLDIWSAVTTTNAPSARGRHTAIWTGQEMLIWGGGGGSVFNDGAMYNPLTDTWQPITTTGANPRYGHSAIWTGSEMLIWGGGGWQ